MTLHEDDPRQPIDFGERGSEVLWVAGAAAVAVVIALIGYAVSTKPANNVTETRPTVTETRSTTGIATTRPPERRSDRATARW